MLRRCCVVGAEPNGPVCGKNHQKASSSRVVVRFRVYANFNNPMRDVGVRGFWGGCDGRVACRRRGCCVNQVERA